MIFKGDFSTELQTQLLNKVQKLTSVPFNLPHTLKLEKINFTSMTENTELEGQIKIEYENYIPKSYIEAIIFEIVHEILGYFLISATHNGTHTTHITVTQPKLELVSYTTLNADLADTNPSILMGVVQFKPIEISPSAFDNFSNYLNRPDIISLQTAQFWLNIANSNHTKDGFGPFDNIKRFTNLWSAFNALYTMYGERNNTDAEWKKVIAIVNYDNSIRNYITTFITKFSDRVQILLELDLRLTQGKFKNENLSGLFKTALTNPSISQDYTFHEYFMLILYALRNNTLHGNGFTQIFNGARIASEFLEGLNKLILQKELLSAT